MKKFLCAATITVILVILNMSIATTSAHAWSQRFHAEVAVNCLGLTSRYIPSYNARFGSFTADFFWHLLNKGLITEETANKLHGATEQECVDENTLYFYGIAADALQSEPWFRRVRLYYFVQGIATHVYADIVAHDPDNGYIELWMDKFKGKVTDYVPDEALHLALEFAVDALLVAKDGFLLNDLLFCRTQANFLQKVLEDEIGPLGFDVIAEFRKYATLVRALEKLAFLYAPILKGEVDGVALLQSEESALVDPNVLTILLLYPNEIYETLTDENLHWETGLDDAILFCQNPALCPP